ncbi:MAG: M23 family metallopeptidase [bacterium]|nr:M23 family metallopeptidase [bacterium]
MPDSAVNQWCAYEPAVRDQTIAKADAIHRFPALYEALKKHSEKYPFKPHEKWFFPVRGYTVKDAGAGGFKPHGYYGSSRIKGYDFFDGNKHGGHAAYDIFVRDVNRDSLDDATGKPVLLTAPVDVMILSIYGEWQKGSGIRGGNYVWALDPLQNRLFYFAHMKDIQVKPGQFCPAGEAIGTMGRTGKNADVARSPTHLHLTVLKIQNGRPLPFDYWKYLENHRNE